ncbi:MAG TPA: protocatechuate 3,4-dioxygenase subunit beta [Vicinamibacterales bacterium]|nr:protocatechuate 3,4-dioxygenase subunit beta [Vicinamibacterales bacterium]
MTRVEGTQPPLLYPPYRSTVLRAPAQPLVIVPERFTGLDAPVYGWRPPEEHESDLSRHAGGDAHGQRIIVAGRLLDSDARPIAGALIEVWQANAAGRYHHGRDNHPAPLDPHFTGAGRVLTDADGRYAFTTIRPGAYPWRNHDNAWRPAHIHFSVFGRSFRHRLVTQMYFPGDPMFAYDPILQSVPDESARQRLVASYDLALTKPEWALGYSFDIVVNGQAPTAFETAR